MPTDCIKTLVWLRMCVLKDCNGLGMQQNLKTNSGRQVSEEEGPLGKLKNRWEDVRKDPGKLLHKNNNRAAEGYWHDWKKKTGQARSRKRVEEPHEEGGRIIWTILCMLLAGIMRHRNVKHNPNSTRYKFYLDSVVLRCHCVTERTDRTYLHTDATPCAATAQSSATPV